MSGFEWFLLIVVVIAVPLVVAVAVTLWTLEQARLRNRKNREAQEPGAAPVKRRATRDAAGGAAAFAAVGVDGAPEVRGDGGNADAVPTPGSTSGGSGDSGGSSGDAGGTSAGGGDSGGGSLR